MILFEQIAGHSVSELKSLEDITIIFYCCIKAGGYEGNYDEFMTLIDDNLDSITDFSNAMIDDSEKKEVAR